LEQELVTPPLDAGLILPRRDAGEIRAGADQAVGSKRRQGERSVWLLEQRPLCVQWGQILYQGQELHITDIDDIEKLTQRICHDINEIHYYLKPHPWMESIDIDGDESLRTVTAN
ncbi:hypothetical protein RRG08_064795, partial [Elysia crispata]